MSQYWCVSICMTVWLVRKCQVYAAHALKRSDTRAQVSAYRQIELITIADADEGLLATENKNLCNIYKTPKNLI